MRDCTDPDCHANAFAAAHGDACPDPSAHERIGDSIAAAVLAAVEPDASAFADALDDAFGTPDTWPDPHADDDPTAATDY